jgi:hypothetical protein
MHVTVNGVHQDSASFDIGWVDQATGQYFLADRTNRAVDQFDANEDRFDGFVGQGVFHSLGGKTCLAMGASDDADCRAPNGVVTDDRHRLWVTDAVDKTTTLSSIKVFPALPNVGLLTSITTGGKFRSDELSYDPQDQLILLANPDVHDAFLTWIDVTNMRVAGTYHYKPTSAGTWGGLEQSVWDPATGLFYQSVPGVADDNGNVVTPGEIDAFSPLPVDGAGQRVAVYQTPGCINGPVGLVRTPSGTLVGACDNGGVVVKLPGGTVEGMIGNVGGADQLAFNPGDGNVYFAIRSGQLGVASASSNQFLAQLLTDPSPIANSHSVAVNIGNNHIFVPIVNQGIKVFTSGTP